MIRLGRHFLIALSLALREDELNTLDDLIKARFESMSNQDVSAKGGKAGSRPLLLRAGCRVPVFIRFRSAAHRSLLQAAHSCSGVALSRRNSLTVSPLPRRVAGSPFRGRTSDQVIRPPS